MLYIANIFHLKMEIVLAILSYNWLWVLTVQS